MADNTITIKTVPQGITGQPQEVGTGASAPQTGANADISHGAAEASASQNGTNASVPQTGTDTAALQNRTDAAALQGRTNAAASQTRKNASAPQKAAENLSSGSADASSLRTASVTRTTKETDISCTLALDGSGQADIKTGIGFFDHMLDGFARHGLFDLSLTCEGDLYVDCHHTIEDCGIVLGQALREAVGDKKGMIRYGSFILPMDEALVLCAVDFGGRPYLGFEHEFKAERVGYFDTEMVREFFYAVSYSAMMNLHFDIMRGTNAHHIIEGCFKAFAKSVDIATTLDPRITDILSTKGTIAR